MHIIEIITLWQHNRDYIEKNNMSIFVIKSQILAICMSFISDEAINQRSIGDTRGGWRHSTIQLQPESWPFNLPVKIFRDVEWHMYNIYHAAVRNGTLEFIDHIVHIFPKFVYNTVCIWHSSLKYHVWIELRHQTKFEGKKLQNRHLQLTQMRPDFYLCVRYTAKNLNQYISQHCIYIVLISNEIFLAINWDSRITTLI